MFVCVHNCALPRRPGGKNRGPGFFNRAWRRHGLDPKQRQAEQDKKVCRPGAARELHMAAKNAAQPLFFLRLESGKPHRVAVHMNRSLNDSRRRRRLATDRPGRRSFPHPDSRPRDRESTPRRRSCIRIRGGLRPQPPPERRCCERRTAHPRGPRQIVRQTSRRRALCCPPERRRVPKPPPARQWQCCRRTGLCLRNRWLRRSSRKFAPEIRNAPKLCPATPKNSQSTPVISRFELPNEDPRRRSTSPLKCAPTARSSFVISKR